MVDSQAHLDGSLLDTPKRNYLLEEPIFCHEYCPVGRYAEGTEGLDGIPSDVLGPDGDWMPTSHWVFLVATHWPRTAGSNASSSSSSSLAPGSSSTKTADYARVMTFGQVMHYRIDKQKRYADATRAGLEAQLMGLQHDHQAVRRFLILRSLGIKRPREGDHHELLDWLESSVVQIPWNDYRGSYLDLDTDAQNPIWGRVQRYLANSNRERGFSDWERLGYRDWSRPVDKGDWTHEDHACRFVLYFYDLLTHPELPQEHKIRGRLAEDKRVGQRATEFDCDRDNAWFGYSLLCLLLRSWQYKQHDTQSLQGSNYPLVPAMYPNYSPHIYMEYPPIQVGEVDLSPFTPWVFDDHRPDTLEDDLSSSDESEYVFEYEDEIESGSEDDYINYRLIN